MINSWSKHSKQLRHFRRYFLITVIDKLYYTWDLLQCRRGIPVMVISWDLKPKLRMSRAIQENISKSNGSSSLKHSICGTFHVFKMAGWDKVPGTCKTPFVKHPHPRDLVLRQIFYYSPPTEKEIHRVWMGLTDQRQWAKNITVYRQNGKKLPTTDRKNINRLQIWTGDITFFQKEEHIYLSRK